MKKEFTIFLLLLFFTVQSFGQETDLSILKTFKGIYQDASGLKYIVNPTDGFPHFTIMGNGETHMLRNKATNVFEFSSTRNGWNTIGGTIEFRSEDDGYIMCLSFKDKKQNCAKAISFNSQELSLTIDDTLFISGDLIQPTNPKNNLVAVLLHGDGENDRYDLFDIGMYLVSEGYSVFAFDKRNAGKSKGSEVEGNGYDEISRVYASDAVKLILRLKKDYPENQFGVVGISQGGWIGSIIASEIPDLSFYVNIAGSISIGWKQWRHYMISYLKRSGFSSNDIIEAKDYFESFFDVGLQRTTFEQYSTKLLQYQLKDWFKKLEKKKLIEWNDESSAIKVVARNSNDPSLDVKSVKAPTLGIFYEFDHSTPPDSPSIFLNSLLLSNAKDVSVRVFPNTTHGGWVVDSYYFNTAKITKMESKACYFIIDWLDSIKQ